MYYDRIVFFNHWHRGDLHVSKEFVKEIIARVPAKSVVYFVWKECSSKSIPDIDCDIVPVLENGGDSISVAETVAKVSVGRQFKLVKVMNPDMYGVQLNDLDMSKGVYVKGNDLYINTWFCSCSSKYYKGCTLQTLYDYFRTELKAVIGYDLLFPIFHYIPQIDCYRPSFQVIRDFCDGKKLVLVCDCEPKSGQGINPDWNLLLDPVMRSNPNVMFISTNRFLERKLTNLVYFDEIYLDEECDLLEVSFIGTFCRAIIGQCSGPHTFCYTKEIMYNKDTNFICLVNSVLDFGLPVLSVSCKIKTFYTSNDFQERGKLCCISTFR